MLHKCQRLNLKRNARSNVRNRKNIHHSWFDINVTQLLLMSWNLFDHPEKPQTVQCFQLKDEGNITRTLIYFMFKWTKQTLQPRRERECTFLTTWRHWSRFFPNVRPFKMDWNAKYSSVRAWLSYLHDLRTFYTILLRCLDGQRQPQAQYLTHSFRGTRN